MFENEVLDKLKAIEEKQNKSEKRASIAFGIALVAIALSLLGPAGQVNLIVAANILGVIGTVIVVWGARGLGRAKKSPCK